MTYKKQTRRNFLTTSALVSAGLIMAGPRLAFSAEPTQKEAMLSRFAYLLYPHENVDGSVFNDAISDLSTSGSEQDNFLQALGERWITLSHDEQVAVLKEQEEIPYFNVAIAHIRGQIYDNPIMWKKIGYGGPSLEYGGYLYRGFDDIDWLPEEEP